MVQTLLLGVWGEPLGEIRKSINPFYDASYSTASCGDSSEIGTIVAVPTISDQELMIYAVAAEEIVARTMHILDGVSISVMQLADR